MAELVVRADEVVLGVRELGCGDRVGASLHPGVGYNRKRVVIEVLHRQLVGVARVHDEGGLVFRHDRLLGESHRAGDTAKEGDDLVVEDLAAHQLRSGVGCSPVVLDVQIDGLAQKAASTVYLLDGEFDGVLVGEAEESERAGQSRDQRDVDATASGGGAASTRSQSQRGDDEHPDSMEDLPASHRVDVSSH